MIGIGDVKRMGPRPGEWTFEGGGDVPKGYELIVEQGLENKVWTTQMDGRKSRNTPVRRRDGFKTLLSSG